MRAVIFAAGLVLTPLAALAHDVDCRGMPVSEAEKQGCCGAGDAHFSDAEHVRQDEHGVWHYLFASVDYPLTREQWVGAKQRTIQVAPIEPLASADGCYTLWYRVRNAVGLFLPENGAIRPGMTPADVAFYCLEVPMPM